MVLKQIPRAAVKSPDFIPLDDTWGLSLISTHSVHTALMVSPHVSFKCGQMADVSRQYSLSEKLEALESSDSFPSLVALPITRTCLGFLGL